MSQGAPVPDEVLADPEACQAAWEAHLDRTGLSPATKRTYKGEVRQFVRWLTEQTEFHVDEVFSSDIVRDQVVRVYRRRLLQHREASGVDTAMASLGNLYAWTGLGAVKIRTAGKPETAPKALTAEDAAKVLRAAERSGPRDLAIVALAVGAGLRVSEIADLDVADFWVSAQKGEVIVRHGKGRDGGKSRRVPLPTQTREALEKWRKARSLWPGADRRDDDGREPLFLSREGRRMAVRTLRHAVTGAGKAAGVEVSPHMLRHTFATQLVRGGRDLAVVRGLMGHESIATTAQYAKPSAADLQAAVEEHAVQF